MQLKPKCTCVCCNTDVHKVDYVGKLDISKTEQFWLKDKLSPDFCHGFFWSEENVDLNYFPHMMVYVCWLHLKGGHTIKDLFMTPKDKDPILKRSGVIYRYKCGRVDCDHKYIGESARNFEERFKEHLKPPPPYMTISTSLVIQSLLTIFPSWGKRTNTSLDSQKRPCT